MCQENLLVLPIGVECSYHSDGPAAHGPNHNQASSCFRLPYRDPPLLIFKLITKINGIAKKGFFGLSG
jgi:hypothetical protein